MDADALFPPRFYKAADFIGAARVLTIKALSIEKMPDGVQKPAISFAEVEQMVVLNKTRSNAIKELYGKETDKWSGKKIECFADKTTLRGDIVDCIGLRKAGDGPSPPSQLPLGDGKDQWSDDMGKG